jgi:DNA mismatch endonuclease, patch repair protein
MMAGIRASDTKPEMMIRRGLHACGLRFRLHVKTLPGTPDLVFPARRAVVFVNGCFWHGHDCHLFRWPSTRADFWHEKIGRNRANDVRHAEALAHSGWRVATIWECCLKGRKRRPLQAVIDEIAEWLASDSSAFELTGINSCFTGSPDGSTI